MAKIRNFQTIEYWMTVGFIGFLIIVGVVFIAFDRGRGPFVTTPLRGKQFLGAIGTLTMLYLILYAGLFWFEPSE